MAEAIEIACKSLKATQEQLDIEVVHTGSAGIFGLCRQKSTIKATLKKQAAPASEESAATSPPPAKKKSSGKKKTTPRPAKAAADKTTAAVSRQPEEEAPLPPEDDDTSPKETHILTEDELETVRADITRLLELMFLPSPVTVSQERGSVLAHITGEHINTIIGEEGRTLDSLQYLLRKMLRKKFPFKINLNLDAGDFRSNRINDLKTLSLKLASEVKETGKTLSIPSLNPSERRVIHMQLQDDKDIRSRSVGEGLFKKVLIYLPTKAKKSGPRKRRSTKQDGS